MAKIYALCCPKTHAVRYIGKANDLEKRLKSHIRDMYRRNTPVYAWMRKLASEGLTPRIVLIEYVGDGDWAEAEKRIIAKASKTQRLLNVAEGGDQPPASDSKTLGERTRALNARIEADPIKKKIRDYKRILGRSRRAGTLSEFTKECMRACAAKRPDLFGEWATV